MRKTKTKVACTMDNLTRNEQTRNQCNTLLALKGILLVATIVLISSTKEISISRPCELEKVLSALSVDNISPCKYNDIKKTSTTLYYMGIFLLVANAIFFLLILNFLWIPKKEENNVKIALVRIVFGVVDVVAIGFSIGMLLYYSKIVNFKETYADTDYAKIKSSMIARLQESYSSDNVTSGGAISNSWNKFFIEYECCAINQVQGTTNDFDSTPWCTTSGSCQSTASQIPKTCCNYVTEEDYGSASTACHSSVSPGTYKSNCMIPIKTISTINIEECQISLLLITLLTIGTLEIIESIFVSVVSILIYYWTRTKIEPGKKMDTETEMKG